MSIKSRYMALMAMALFSQDKCANMAFEGHYNDFMHGRQKMISGGLISGNGRNRKRKKNMITVSKQMRRKHRRAA